MTPSDSQAPPERRGGVTWILGATIIAGAFGYLIQLAVPAFITPESYVAFSVFWSVLYLLVSAVSGVQQEIARAARPSDEHAGGHRTLWQFTVGASVVGVLLVIVSAPFWASAVFGSASSGLVAALAFAILGYTCVAAFSGALYGVRDWPGVAAMTITDAGLRVGTVAVALVAGAGILLLGWAVAVPFAVTFLVILAVRWRRVVGRIELDRTVWGLARNSLSTVAGAAAIGLMVSGLPFILGLVFAHAQTQLLASLILVITLARAPLVVPLLALQSYLIVQFRDARDHVARAVLRWGGGLAAVTAVLSAAAVLVGPWVIELLYGDRYTLPPGAYGAIVVSAGLTGILCVTGAAVLAAGRHGLYVGGWAIACGALVLALLWPGDMLGRVLIALIVAPVLGVVTHLFGVRASRSRS